jgi:hypothetical protein
VSVVSFLQQGAFTRLSQAGKHDDGQVRGGGLEPGGEVAMKIGMCHNSTRHGVILTACRVLFWAGGSEVAGAGSWPKCGESWEFWLFFILVPVHFYVNV